VAGQNYGRAESDEQIAFVLAEQWRVANEPNDDGRFRSSVDFSRIAEKRAKRAALPTTSFPFRPRT
jgi:hypothetical protein